MDPRVAFEKRRGSVERAREMEGGMFEVVGFIEVTGSGEATVDVNFPVTFLERPYVSGAGEVAENQALAAGGFPTFRVGVQRWHTVPSTELPERLKYRGATLVVVVEGVSSVGFRGVVHWSVRGRALVNPTVGGL